MNRFPSLRHIVTMFITALLLLISTHSTLNFPATAQGGINRINLPFITSQLTPIIPSTTVPLDEAALAALVIVSPDGTFTFQDTAPILDTLDPGDIMAGDITPAAPNGFLKQVLSITEQNGQIILQTGPTTLVQAIQQGVVSLNRTLTPDMIRSAELAQGVRLLPATRDPNVEFYVELEDVVLFDDDGNLNTTNDQIRANGSVTLEPTVHFSLAIRDGELESLDFNHHLRETADLEIFSEIDLPFLEERKELARFTLSPITVMAGPVPVVLLPVITINVGADGNISVGVTTHATQTGTFLAGIRYQDDQWQPVNNTDLDFSYIPPTVYASLELKGYAGPRVALLLYGIAGPYADVHGYLEFEANTNETPWWHLWGGIEAIVGVALDLIVTTIESPEIPVIGVRQLLASAPTSPPTATPTPPSGPVGTTRVSVASDRTQANDESYSPSVSADGRYIAYFSHATNLVGSDTNARADIFVHDRQIGVTTRVSVASDGTQANGGSGWPSISADGRYVTYHSDATNLVIGDTNGQWDIFVYDRQTSTTTRVSVASGGNQANGNSYRPTSSANGRYVAYHSIATNLINGDTNTIADIFVHDRQSGATTRVSVASDGTQANGGSDSPTISADGRYVAYHSDATNLVIGDTNGQWDIFVYDQQTSTTTRVSVTSNGNQANGVSASPTISADGCYVTYHSGATNLVNSDTNARADIFIHDCKSGATIRVSVASDGNQANDESYIPTISADGRYVAYFSYATNLVNSDTNLKGDIFVHDRQSGATTRVSVASDGSQANEHSWKPSISADGRYVTFSSQASNLVSNDTNGTSDIFVHNRSP